MANNRTCLLCGTSYKYCPSCREDIRKPSWMSGFDREDCKIMFETLSSYGMKLMSASEAKKIISKIDYESMNLNKQKKDTIKEILGNKSTVEKTPVVEVKEEIIETPAPIESDVEKPTEAIEKIVKEEEKDETPTTFKKRKFNYNNISE